MINISIKHSWNGERKKFDLNKENLEKITNQVEDISKKVDSIMHNRLIIAIFMIVDGICFILDPINKMEFIAQTVAWGAILASIAVLATNIKSQKRDMKSIIVAIVIILISICTIIFPKILAINLRILLAIFIILNGLINIFNVIKLDKMSSYLSNAENDIKDKISGDETDNAFNNGVIMEQTEKIINPFNRVIEKASENTILYFILNSISVILGIVLFTNNNMTLILCGIILVYTGLIDLLMFAKSIKLSKKMK